MLCQVFGKVPGTKQPSGEYTNRFHGNSYVPNTRQGEERLPWDHTHQKVVFPVYELRMYAEIMHTRAIAGVRNIACE